MMTLMAVAFLVSMPFVVTGETGTPASCQSGGDAAVCAAQLAAQVEDAETESLSLAQLRAAQRHQDAFVPSYNQEYVLEAYIVEFKSFGIDKCGTPPHRYARIGTVGNKTTGCLQNQVEDNWFTDQGFDEAQSSVQGTDPEILITFEAWQNEFGDRCMHTEQDTCHFHEEQMLTASQIENSDVWMRLKMGSQHVGHEMFVNYRLTALTTTSTTTTTIPEAECKIFGDPHVIGFDKGDVSLLKMALLGGKQIVSDDATSFESGDFWLVKSPLVSIQGRFNEVGNEKKQTFLRVLAVSGPFIENNTLLIGSMVGNHTAKAFWNDEAILPEMGSVFENDLVKAKWANDTELVQDPQRSAEGVRMELPMGIEMVINRGRNGLGLKLNMKRMEGMDGQCGNFNGDGTDDTEELIAERVGYEISSKELLFRRTLNGDLIDQDAAQSVWTAMTHPLSWLRSR